MLTVDLMHEVELGVFKSVFRHLLRLLYTINREAIEVINDRYVTNIRAPSTLTILYSDSVRSHHLGKVLFGAFLLMYQICISVQRGILRTSSR